MLSQCYLHRGAKLGSIQPEFNLYWDLFWKKKKIPVLSLEL